jgi:hypothetical protein
MKMHAYLLQSKHPTLFQRAVLLRLLGSCGGANLSARDWRELLGGENDLPIAEISDGGKTRSEVGNGGDKQSPSEGSGTLRRGLCGAFFRRREHRHPSILPGAAQCCPKYFARPTRHEEALALFLRLRPALRRDRRSPSLVSGFLFLGFVSIRLQSTLDKVLYTHRNLKQEVFFSC